MLATLGAPDHRRSKERSVRLPKCCSRIEKRSAKRYPLDLDLNYTVLDGSDSPNSGRGRTIDVSSSGLRFAGERPIEVGLKIDLAVRWPVTLDGGVPLQLVGSGEVVRADNEETAVRILKYEFRTRCRIVIYDRDQVD